MISSMARRSVRHSRSIKQIKSLLAITVMSAAGLWGSVAGAANVDWNDGGTNWSSGGDWSGGTAPTSDLTTDIARFLLSTYNNTVAITTPTSVNGIIIGSSGTLAIDATTNTLTLGAGGITIGTGTASFSGTLALGAGQTWTNNSASTTSNFTVGAIDNGANLLTVAGSGVTTIAGVIGSGGTKSGGLTKMGGGTLVLSAANAFTGTTTIAGGTLILGGANGALGASTGVTLSNRATLTLDNSSSNNSNRVNDGATITATGGIFNFNQNAAATDPSESLGNVALNAGALDINTGQAASGHTSTLTVAQMSRAAGGTILLSGTGLGTDGRNAVAITAAGTGWAATNSILPFAVVYNGTSYDWVGSTTGNIAPLAAGSYTTGDETNWSGATINARPAASTAMSTTRVINSLVLGDTINVTVGTTGKSLTVTSGAILQTGGSSTLNLIGTGNNTLATGTAEAIFHTEGNLTILLKTATATQTTGSGGITKTGPGTLTFGSDAVPDERIGTTGRLRLNQGLFEIYANLAASLSTLSTGLDFNGGNLLIHETGGLSFNNPTTVNADGTLTIDRRTGLLGAGTTATFGTLSIGSQTLTVTGGASINAAGPFGATYAGTTLTGNPTFNVASGAATGGASALVTLGALGDGTVVPRTITKTGNGALTLATLASSLINGTRFNISGGTLNSNLNGALGTLAVVDVADGAVFSAGVTQAIGALSDSTGVTHTASAVISSTAGVTLTVGSTNNLDSAFSGAISGGSATGGLTKAGTGTFTLSGTNSYAGLTTVNAGSLLLATASGNAIAGGGLTVNAGGVVKYTGASGDMMGAGAVTINSTGQLDFNGKTDTIGNVAIVATGAGGGSTAIVNTAGGGNLTIGTLGITPVAGFTSVVNSGTGTLTLGGNVTFTAATTGQAKISGDLDLGGATRTFTVGLGTATAPNYDLLVDAVISGGAGFGITKAGTGTLKLSGANTFDGALTAGNTLGTVILANNQAMGVPTAARAWTFGTTDTLALVGGITLGNPSSFITWQINGTGDSRLGTTPGAIVNISGNNTAPVAITLAAASTIGSLNAGDKLTLSGGISGATFGLTVSGVGDAELSGGITTTTGTLTKTGTGTLTLSGSGANTFSGLTTIAGGSGTLLLAKSGSANAIAGGGLTIGGANNTAATVQYAASTGNPDMMGAGAVTINGRGILDFNGATDTIGNVAIVSTGATTSNPTPIINTAGGGNLTIGTLGITPVAGFSSQINLNSGTLTLGGNVTFTAATTGQAQIKGGTLALGGSRTFNVGVGTGGTYDLDINVPITGGGSDTLQMITTAGRMQFSGGSANTYGGLTTMNIAGGTLLLNKTAGVDAIGSGGLTITAGTVTLSASNQINDAAAVTLNGGTLNTGTALADTVNSLAVSGTGTVGGTGTVTIGGGSATTMASGTISAALVLGSGGLLINPSAALTATVSGGVTSSGASTNITITNAGSGAVTLGAGGINNQGTITNNGGGTGTTTISGVIGAGVTSMSESGASPLSLTADSGATFSGPVTVSAGVLSIGNTTGSATGSGTVTLSGGTLASATGSSVGFITGSVTAGSGAHIIAPGGAGTMGHFTINNLATSSNTTLSFDVTAPATVTDDELLVTGTATIGAGTNVSVAGTAATTKGFYKLISNSGISSIANFGTLSISGAVPAGQAYGLTTGHDSGWVDLFVTSASARIYNSTGNWSVAANWTPGVVPQYAGDQASEGTSNAVTTTTLLDMSVTLGTLSITYRDNWVINSDGTHTITMDNLGYGAPTIQIPANGATKGGLTVNPNIIIGDSINGLQINDMGNYVSTAVTIGGTVTGSGPLSIGLKATTGIIASVTLNGLVNNSGTLTVTGGAAASDTATFTTIGSNVTSLTKNGLSTAIITRDNTTTFSAPVTVSAGTLQFGDGATGHDGAIGTASIADNATVAFNPYVSQSTATIITGTGGVTKVGTGIEILTGANTYTGTTAINGGFLNVGVAENAGTAGPLGKSAASNPGSITFGGGTLQFSSVNTTDYSGRFATTAQAISIDPNGQAVSFGTAMMSGAAGTLTVNDTAVTKGSLTLTAANSYTGATTVTAGTLKIGINDALPTASALTLGTAASATFDLNNFNQTVGQLTGGSTTGGTVTNSGSAVHTLTINIASGSTTYSGSLSGAKLALAKLGNGQLLFSASLTTPTYGGGFTINGGQVSMTNYSAAMGSGTIDFQSGTIDNGGSTNALGISAPMTLDGPSLAFNQTSGSSLGFSGGMTLAQSTIISVNSGTVRFGVNGHNAGTGILQSGSTTFNITKDGPGTLVLEGVGTYTGTTTVAGGTLAVIDSTALGTGTSAIVVGSSTSTSNAALGLNSIQNGNVGTPALTRNVLIQPNHGFTTTLTNSAIDTPSGNALTSATWSGTITFNQNLIISAPAGTNIFTNTWTGQGNALTINGANTTIYQNGTATPNFAGGTTINSGALRYVYDEGSTAAIATAQWAKASYNSGGDTYSGIGAITLQGGSFEFQSTASSGTSNAVVTFPNALTVTVAGGGFFGLQTGTANATNNAFSGGIDLGGMLGIGTQSTGYVGNAQHFSGKITINNVAVGRAGLSGQTASGPDSIIDGNIVDGIQSAIRNPLILRSVSGGVQIASSGNTYSAGTIVEACVGTTAVGANGVLGTGSVVVESGGSIRLNAGGNIATGQTIQVSAGGLAMGIVSLGTDFDPGISSTGIRLTSDSAGVLAIDSGTYNTALNFTNLGNGSMFLGSIGTTSTYGGTLTPAGGTYRLGGGGGTLTFSGSNVLGSTNSLIVGANATNGTGTVKLTNSNNFSGTITVNSGSTLEGSALSSNNPFGNAAGAVTLNSGTVQLDATAGSSYSAALGAVTANGASTIKIGTANTGTAITTLTLAALGRGSNNGIVYLNTASAMGSASGPAQRIIDSNNATDLSTTALNGGGTMLTTPFVLGSAALSVTNSGFLTYGTNGFAVVVPTRLDTGAANTLAGSASNDLVYITGADTSLTGSGTTIIQALTINLSNAAVNNASGTPTLSIAGGGLIMAAGQSGPLTLGGGGMTLNFGAEAIINVTSTTMGSTISAPITNTSGGLTKTGAGQLILSNSNNSFTGTVTVDQGMLSTGFAANGTSDTLGVAGNPVVLNGGTLSIGNAIDHAGTFSRAVSLGTVGGQILLSQVGGLGRAFTIASSISGATGTGPLTLAVTTGDTVTLNSSGANTYTGGTIVAASGGAASLTVASGTALGTGDVAVINNGNAMNLILNGDTSITSGTNGANVRVDLGSTITFQGGTGTGVNAGAPAIGSLQGSGSVVLGKSGGVATNLTVGSNNASTAFDGVISQAAGAAASSLTKVGTGTFTLANAQGYTGGTSVTAGKLVVSGSVLGGATISGTTSTLGGTGMITGNVTYSSTTGSTFTGVIVGSLDYSSTGAAATSSFGVIESSTALQSTYTGTTTIAGGKVITASAIRQDTLSLGAGTALTLRESSIGAAGTLISGWPSGDNNAVSVIRNLNFDHTAKLDVTNNDLILTGMSASDVEKMVRNGYDNGAWDGNGTSYGLPSIYSSDAAARNIFTLLVIDSSAFPAGFDGVAAIPANSVIVKFTHEADLNGDGVVTGTGANNDLSLFASYYAAYNVDNGTSTQRAVTHAQGDMDFDGALTFNDAMLFTVYYNEGLAHLPEPTSLAFLALGAAGLLARKRR